MPEKKPKIIEVKPVWSVISNTDLTEGRGGRVVLFVCEMETTARRKAIKRGVQGSNAYVEAGVALVVETGEGEVTYIPGRVERPSKEDRAVQEKADALEVALAKAKAAGLSEEDLKILRGGK